MNKGMLKKVLLLLTVALVLAGVAACGGAQPQVVEKVVTVEVEKEVEKIVTGLTLGAFK